MIAAPHGVDLPTVGRAEISEPRVRTALFLGRIHPIKGLLALEAAGLLRRRLLGWLILLLRVLLRRRRLLGGRILLGRRLLITPGLLLVGVALGADRLG